MPSSAPLLDPSALPLALHHPVIPVDRQAISLDGVWRLSGRPLTGGDSIRLDAQVPGHVHLDLLKAGRIPDPFYRDQADQCQWVERCDWTYEREFVVAAALVGRRAVLDFAGLDTFATIYLNGVELGRTANMFIGHRFEVGPELQAGRNTLRIHFDSIWRHVADKPRDAECAFENQERLYVRRMQCTFHWDWVNRFVSAGIWRPVTLSFPAVARIEDVFVSTRALTLGARDANGLPHAQRAQLRLRVETGHEVATAVSMHLVIRGTHGEILWTATHSLTGVRGPNLLELDVKLTAPALWWPNGTGPRHLHTCEVTLSNGSDHELDRKVITFGVRTVVIEHTPDAPGSPAEARTRELRAAYPERETGNGDTPGVGFAVLVNGERIFCKGANWVPADPWPSRISPDWYKRLLKLARSAHINCLRAWGGGIYEPPAFWEACDHLGLLVAQDFQTACAHYPEADPEFIAAMQAEAPAAIRQLRNHPSLAWWIGDNENGMKFDHDDPAMAGRRTAETIFTPALRQLDPDRPFIPTSPFGGRPNNSPTIGDVHQSALPYDQAGINRDWSGYRSWIHDSIGRFNSECVTAGCPPMRSLRRFMTEADIADHYSPLWYYHTKDNPYINIRLFDIQREVANRLFGPLKNPDDFVPRLEYGQYEFTRLTIEAARRQKGYNQGLLFWMFNDCWPATGWSFVDSYGTPKAAWYAMKRGFQPVIASIEDAGDCYRFFVCNDRLKPIAGTAQLRWMPWTGTALWEKTLPFAVPANTSCEIARIAKSALPAGLEAAVFVCDLESPDAKDRAWYFNGLPAAMNPPPAQLTAQWVEPAFSRTLEIKSSSYARVVTLDADTALTDNYFDLLPGETKLVTLSEAKTFDQPIAITWWNACAGQKLIINPGTSPL